MSLKTFELLGVLECSPVRFAATEVSLPPGIRSGLVCVEEKEEEDTFLFLFLFFIIFKYNQVWQDVYFSYTSFKYHPIKIVSYEWVFILIPMTEVSVFKM